MCGCFRFNERVTESAKGVCPDQRLLNSPVSYETPNIHATNQGMFKAAHQYLPAMLKGAPGSDELYGHWNKAWTLMREWPEAKWSGSG